MTQDTEQETRLDFEDHGEPDVATCGFIVSTSLVFDGDGPENEYEVRFSFGGETVARDEAEVAGFQREYEAALIARALRVATDEELDAAGLDRRAVPSPEDEAAMRETLGVLRAERREATNEELAKAGLVRVEQHTRWRALAVPRRPLFDDEPDGYQESDIDWSRNNNGLVVEVLEWLTDEKHPRRSRDVVDSEQVVARESGGAA